VPLGSPYRALIKRNAPFPEPYIICVSRSPQYRSPSSRFLSLSMYKERDASFPKPSLTYLSGVPIKGAPTPVFPYGAPVCRDRGSISRTYFYVSFRVPSKEALPLGSPKSSHRERRSVSIAFFYLSFKVPRKRAPHPPGSPNTVPYEDMLISRAFFDVITNL